MKKLFIIKILIIAICVMGAYGCSMVTKRNNTDNNDTVIYELKEYFEYKYNTTDYSFVAFRESGWDSAYDTLVLKTNIDGKDYNFEVLRYSENNEVKYKDNYYGLLIKKQYEEMLDNYIEDYFETFHVSSSTISIFYPDNLDENSDVNELLSIKNDVKGRIATVVVIKESTDNAEDFELKAKNCCEFLNDKCLDTLWHFICVTEETYNDMCINGFENATGLTTETGKIAELVY